MPVRSVEKNSRVMCASSNNAQLQFAQGEGISLDLIVPVLQSTRFGDIRAQMSALAVDSGTGTIWYV